MTFLRLIREHAQAEQEFLAAIHGVQLTEQGSADAPSTGIRAFNDRLKKRLTGR